MNSMTGYGQAEKTNEQYGLSIELKSVNNRFLDLQIRMPKELNAYEGQLRQIAKNYTARGRVDVFIHLTSLNNGQKKVEIHWDLLDQFVEKLKSGARENFGVRNFPVEQVLIKAMEQEDFVSFADQPIEAESLEQLVEETASAAFAQLADSRKQEGTGIKQVLKANQHELAAVVDSLQSFVSDYEADFQERYKAKLEEYLGSSVEQERLLTELAILIERGDIHEELDRLSIHLKKMNQLLEQTEPVGRELDFLLQEMNREVNTIGSKSSPIAIKDAVVRAKTILEKIREQIQNVE